MATVVNLSYVRVLFFPAQVLEASLREHKRELEELLSRSIEMQKRQLLLPQEKVSVPDVSSALAIEERK